MMKFHVIVIATVLIHTGRFVLHMAESEADDSRGKKSFSREVNQMRLDVFTAIVLLTKL